MGNIFKNYFKIICTIFILVIITSFHANGSETIKSYQLEKWLHHTISPLLPNELNLSRDEVILLKKLYSTSGCVKINEETFPSSEYDDETNHTIFIRRSRKIFG